MSFSNKIPRSIRRQTFVTGAGQTAFGPTTIKVYDALDVAVLVKAPGATAYVALISSAYTVNLTGAAPSVFTVTLAAAQPTGTSLRVEGRRLHERQTDVTQGGVIRSVALETELDRQSIILQELRRDVDENSADIAALNGRLTSVEAENVEQDVRLAAIDAEQAVQNGRLAALDAGQVEQNTSLAVLFGGQAELNARMAALQALVATISPGEQVALPELAGASETGNPAENGAAFAVLVGAMRGEPVNLNGKTYPVDVVPDGAKFYGGGFRTPDGALATVPEVYRPHPFTGHALLVARYPFSHWPAGLAFSRSTKRVYRFEVVGERHDLTSGSRLDMLVSYDFGRSWLERRTIFSDVANPRVRAGAIGNLSNGRIGGLISTGDTVRKQFAIYSDDEGATFTIVDVTAQVPSADHFIYSEIKPGPSGAVGDFFISTYGGTASAKIVRTLDNCVSWSDQVNKSADGLPGGSPVPAEQSYVAVPGRGWIMFTRVETTPVVGRNMWASVSVDFVNWGPWIDTGVRLGSNPVEAYYDGGKVHVLCMQRGGFPGAPGTVGAFDDYRPDAQFCYSVEANRIFDDPAMLSRTAPQLVSAMPQRAIGYVQSLRLSMSDQDKHAPWLHVFKTEGPSSTLRPVRSEVVIVSDLPGPAAGPQLVSAPVQLVENPIFTHWPRGTAFTVTGADVGLAGRWHSTRSGAAALIVERVELTAEQRRRFASRPRYGMRIRNTGAPDDYVGVSQRHLNERGVSFVRGLMPAWDWLLRMSGFGEFPGNWIANLATNAGTFASGAFPRVPTGQTASWISEARIFNTTLVPDLPDITQASLNLSNGAVVGEFDFTIVDVRLMPVGAAVDMDTGEPADTAERVADYCEVFAGSGARLCEGLVKSASNAVLSRELRRTMAGTPTVTMSDIADFEIEAATATYPVEAAVLTANRVMLQASVTLTGAATGAGRLRAKNADAWLRADTGY